LAGQMPSCRPRMRATHLPAAPEFHEQRLLYLTRARLDRQA
jgi:hypothetical protein